MRLNFTITAEDPETVRQALAIQPGQRLLCLCSAGDTPLNLLKYDPASVDAIDINPAQVHLGILKAISLKELPFGKYRHLLGIEGHSGAATAAYALVRPFLPVETRRFWDSHRRLVARGLLWQGRVQRLFRLVRKALGALGMRRLLTELVQLRTPTDIASFERRYINGRPYRWLWRALLNEFTYRVFCAKEARQRLGPAVSGRQFFMERVAFAVSRAPVASAYMLPQILGCYPDDVYPPYLDPAEIDMIRQRVDRIRFHVGDVGSYLRTSGADSFDGISLSNLGDWLTGEQLQTLLTISAAAVRSGGRILAYSRIAPVELSGLASAGLRPLPELAVWLAATDRTGYYPHLLVLEVKKGESLH